MKCSKYMYIYILLHGIVSINDTRSYKGLLNINILQNMDWCSHFLLVCKKCIFSTEIMIAVSCFAQFITCFVTTRLVANHLSLCNAFIINGARKEMFILFSHRKLDFRKTWTVKRCTYIRLIRIILFKVKVHDYLWVSTWKTCSVV